MHEEAQGVVDFQCAQGVRRLHALGVVRDGGDDAAFVAAVAVEVHVTRVWGVVFGVDVVEYTAEFALVGVLVSVRPCRHVRQIA